MRNTGHEHEHEHEIRGGSVCVHQVLAFRCPSLSPISHPVSGLDVRRSRRSGLKSW